MSEWNQKRGTMQHYNLTARTYDVQYAEEQKAKFETALEKMEIYENSTILDCGCGTGLLFEYVAEKAATVVGLDVSRKLLDKAKNRASQFSNVHLILADADHMPFKNEVFSHVFAVTVIQNMPNPEKTLVEIKRVASGSAFIVVTGLKKKFSKEALESVLRKIKLNVIEIKSGNETLKCHVAVCTKN
ncbi:class I SAM-dependent methyltransferase [Candidatus Bathyarchaeota archaeon]|nr:class I SAM-dependent methyltransferase [Candidatus Bathyarchaeota archaeon]